VEPTLIIALPPHCCSQPVSEWFPRGVAPEWSAGWARTSWSFATLSMEVHQ